MDVDNIPTKKLDQTLKDQKAEDNKSLSKLSYSIYNSIDSIDFADLSLLSANCRQLLHERINKILKKQNSEDEIEVESFSSSSY